MLSRSFKSFATLLAIGALAVLSTAQSAHATLAIRVFNGPTATGTPILVATDNGQTPPTPTVLDQDPAPGQLLLPTQTIGGLGVQNSFDTSNANFANIIAPFVDTARGQAVLTTSSNAVANNTGSTIVQTIQVSDTNFGPFGLPAVFTTTASGSWTNPTVSNTLGSSIHVTYFADSNNTLWGTAQTVRDVTFNAAGIALDSYSASAQNLGPFNDIGTNPFSMTIQFVLTLTPGTTLLSRGNAINATAVPEPATLGAALCGLVGVAAVARARRRKAS